MAFGSLLDEDSEVMSEINMTPLVDVMLVLLIIFIITLPVINHAVKLELPRASNQPNDAKPEHINLSIDNDGAILWNGERTDENGLKSHIALAAQQDPQPELHLRADRKTPYESVAKVMAAAQSGGLGKIGFITEPQP
ncbi:MAG TPA: biopolymer transporter ExbD [Noviherbaspirillum sp.]|nr:biopolymer transporter ExbD [Noviherbaspirillum sp.]